jgi:hypothetical protein
VDYLQLSYSFKKRKAWRYRKSTSCAICWLKSVLHEKTRRTGSDRGRTNATKTASDVFRHRSRTGKSYCRTRFDVGSERIKFQQASSFSEICNIWLYSVFNVIVSYTVLEKYVHKQKGWECTE